MDVVIHSSGMPFNGETTRTRSLGGSETAAFELARELARRGHRVKVFTSLREPQESQCDGVMYIWHGETSENAPLGERFELYAANTPHDVLVIQRHPLAFHKRYACKVGILQLHDLALYRSSRALLGGTWQMDAITCVSEWHRQQVATVYQFNPETLHVVPNGVDPALYDGEYRFTLDRAVDGPFVRVSEDIARVPRDRFLLLYQSRPERGLDHALELMARARQRNLPVHLLVCGYDNTTATMRARYEQLWARCSEAPNVTLLGSLSKPQLASVQRQCDLLFYPTRFEEVSCITAMEAMHASLPMLTSACAALPETCADSGTHLVPLTAAGEPDLDAFEAWLVETFAAEPGRYPAVLQEMRMRQHAAARSRTWADVTDRFEALVSALFKRAQSSTGAIVRDALEHSDIEFAEHVLARSAVQDRISASVRDEIERLYSFRRNAEEYVAHYEKHQSHYYREHGHRVIGEDVTHTTRFRGVMDQFSEHVLRTKASSLRVLDFGCAHGHYTIPFAKRFPTCEFVGLDITAEAIEAAETWRAREQLENVRFVRGSQEALSELGAFDVILAGEVLEHVPDYCGLLNAFKRQLNRGGCLIVTTPSGRWEHSGTVEFRTGREHLHHFERADIDDICSGHDLRVLNAPAGADKSGKALGSWVWAVWPSPTIPFWRVDYDRKLSQYVPRQTISACMIVKNGEATLRRCVESFVDWVDEVVVCIDPTTTDRTLDLVRALAADFPNRPFVYGVAEHSALRDGFEAARNESIAQATGDWILWVDSDEEIRHPAALHRFARQSMHNGFGFAQVHYAVDPDRVLTTDYPCRLFRNHLGIRFYGMVHEHPEQEIGKAVPYSVVRPEVKFLHHGYYDEETRRNRFYRNLPLLRADVEKYGSSRPLNRFLLLRDIAQGIQFESEKYGPQPHHIEKAREGIRIMEQIVDLPQTKMISDAMQYYSLCVATTGTGFDAEISFRTTHAEAPSLSGQATVSARFHSREFYLKMVETFSKEMTKYYEERYL